jgi:Flp pilus assembly protein CpaB
LQGVEILAVDQRVEAPAENKVDPKDLRSVTLLVTPEQGAKLTLAQNQGTLHLALRNPQDDQPASVRPVTLADFKFYQESPWRGLAASTTKGMRAMTIQTSNVASGVGGLIVPGNRVDVLLIGNVKTPAKGTRSEGAAAETIVPKCVTLLQNVTVLAVDSRVDASGEKEEGAAPKAESKIDTKGLQYLNVTLLVTREEAAALALAQNLGLLHLALRHPDDQEIVDTRLEELKQRPAEPKAAPPRAWVRTLRGVYEGGVELRRGQAPEVR